MGHLLLGTLIALVTAGIHLLSGGSLGSALLLYVAAGSGITLASAVLHLACGSVRRAIGLGLSVPVDDPR